MGLGFGPLSESVTHAQPLDEPRLPLTNGRSGPEMSIVSGSLCEISRVSEGLRCPANGPWPGLSDTSSMLTLDLTAGRDLALRKARDSLQSRMPSEIPAASTVLALTFRRRCHQDSGTLFLGGRGVGGYSREMRTR